MTQQSHEQHSNGQHHGHLHHDPHPDHVPAIHFMVDGEPYDTRAAELTPDEIIREFAGQDPGSHYLVQIQGHERISFQDKGDQPIRMKDGLRFQVISTGPTPVSFE
ncbi:MAG: hypothetical protein V4540_14505 [Pseudomonadota bacterium]